MLALRSSSESYYIPHDGNNHVKVVYRLWRNGLTDASINHLINIAQSSKKLEWLWYVKIYAVAILWKCYI